MGKSNTKKDGKQGKTNDEFEKNELIRSLEEMGVLENEEKVIKYDKGIPVIEDYEKIIWSRKKGILNFTFRQEKILKKLRF